MRSRVRSTRTKRTFCKWKKYMDDFFHGQLGMLAEREPLRVAQAAGSRTTCPESRLAALSPRRAPGRPATQCLHFPRQRLESAFVGQQPILWHTAMKPVGC